MNEIESSSKVFKHDLNNKVKLENKMANELSKKNQYLAKIRAKNAKNEELEFTQQSQDRS